MEFEPSSSHQACLLDWSDCTIPGVTYGHNSHYLSPFAVFKLRQDEAPNTHSQVCTTHGWCLINYYLI